MKFYKMLFLFTLMLGTLISISSNSWFLMWLGLEINLISIMPLFKMQKNMYSTEATIKYFITQALASNLILFSIIISHMTPEMIINSKNLILDSALLTKMGAAPFHFWFPEVMEGLNWINCFILLSWQKIAPMILLMYNSCLSLFMMMIIITSMIIGGIQGFNQISLRKIMAFSSINHIGWMLSIMFNSQMIWIIYFMIYSIISFNIIWFFSKFKLFYFNQLFFSMNKNYMFKILFIVNFFSLGGLPPFLGFLPKWLTINSNISNNLYLISFVMIILTLITMYFYIRITFSTILINSSKSLINPLNMSFFWMINTIFFSLFSLILYPLIFLF